MTLYPTKCIKSTLTRIHGCTSCNLAVWEIATGIAGVCVYGRGGQTAAREPHAAFRTFACGSLSFPKHYIFTFYFYCKVQKYCKVVLW